MLRAEAHDSAVNFAGAANNAYARFLDHDNTGTSPASDLEGTVTARALEASSWEPDIDRRWERVFGELDLENAKLLHVSEFDRGRRTYLRSGRIYKIMYKALEETRARRALSLSGECEVLKKLQDVHGVPRNCAYCATSTVEILSYDFIEGQPLSKVLLTNIQRLLVLHKIAVVLTQISRQGIAHNDILMRNVLVNGAGSVALIDFDQSMETSPAKALLANFTGVTLGMNKSYGSFSTVAKHLFLDSLPSPVSDAIRQARKKIKYFFANTPLPRIPKTAAPKLHKLHEAWSIALQSDANSPGVPICYYELWEDNYRLPGERPWAERWAAFRSLTDYKNKRVLELGCNLSLLSCFLLKEAGAQDALCVDADARILAAAQFVADAYGVAPLYRRVNVDAPQDWESQLLSFRPDVVFALSVFNWVRDQSRLLRFLSNFNELIFEGHELFEVERGRFLQVGFKEIKQVATSERNRPVMVCRK
ncbi:hypothetical protein BH20PSE1_BH20PSE1_13660 [soil metagenome]